MTADPKTWLDIVDSLVTQLPAIIAACAAVASIVVSNNRAKSVKEDLKTAKDDLKKDNAAHTEVLGEVKVLVNGNLTKEKKEVVRLKALLAEHGIADRP